MTRYFSDWFDPNAVTTIGLAWAWRIVRVEDKAIKVMIWDTAGQERFRSVVTRFYQGAVGALLVYDICNRQSFDSLDYWLNELRNNVSRSTVILVVGNKVDLAESRTVAHSEGLEFAEKNNLAFIETSALDSTNVEKAFFDILTEIFMNDAFQTQDPEAHHLEDPSLTGQDSAKCSC